MHSNETVSDISHSAGLTPFSRILRLYLRSGLRGATRLTFSNGATFRIVAARSTTEYQVGPPYI